MYLSIIESAFNSVNDSAMVTNIPGKSVLSVDTVSSYGDVTSFVSIRFCLCCHFWNSQL